MQEHQQKLHVERREKERAKKCLVDQQENHSKMLQATQQELKRLKEETFQKDLILQEIQEEATKKEKHAKEKLGNAEKKFREELEHTESLLSTQQRTVREELQRKTREVETLQQDVLAKTAQVKQYKKQIDSLQEQKDGKQQQQRQQETQGNTQEIEDVRYVHVVYLPTLLYTFRVNQYHVCAGMARMHIVINFIFMVFSSMFMYIVTT